MLTNVRIAGKIGIVIVLLSGVALAISGLGIYGINRITDNAKTINVFGRDIRTGAQMYIEILKISRGEYRAALVPQERGDVLKDTSDQKEQFEKNGPRLKKKSQQRNAKN